MSVDFEAIGSRIRQRRKEKGVTQQYLAQGLDVTIGYVSQLERGITKSNLETLSKIAELLDCNLAYLVAGVSTAGKDYMQDEISQRISLLDERQKRMVLEFLDTIIRYGE